MLGLPRNKLLLHGLYYACGSYSLFQERSLGFAPVDTSTFSANRRHSSSEPCHAASQCMKRLHPAAIAPDETSSTSTDTGTLKEDNTKQTKHTGWISISHTSHRSFSRNSITWPLPSVQCFSYACTLGKASTCGAGSSHISATAAYQVGEKDVIRFYTSRNGGIPSH